MSVPAFAKAGVPVIALIALAALAACGGGGGGGGMPPSTGTTSPPMSTQQVIGMALPQSAIGQETDPTWGAIGGFTQSTNSQVLAFAPGAQVMLKNLGSGVGAAAHTLNVIASNVKPGMAFPPSAGSTTASGGTTIGSGFASGALNPGQLVGPFTLAQGTYYLGCAFHYISNGMRGVLIVQPGATPGPQATPQPAPSTTGSPCIGYNC